MFFFEVFGVNLFDHFECKLFFLVSLFDVVLMLVMDELFS